MTTVMTGLILCYALLARRMSFANLTAPMAHRGRDDRLLRPYRRRGRIRPHPPRIALVIILFHGRVDGAVGPIASRPDDPFRLLAIGFPVALLAAYLVTWAMLPALGIAGALLIAAAITPTDAGLGAPTVLNPAVRFRVGEP